MEATKQRSIATWPRTLMLVLLAEKVIQHVAVTTAFATNWHGIRSTVAVSPDSLMFSGGLIAVVFAAALWAQWTRRGWATGLVIALALFDMIGEFIAQGTIAIQLNVSFVVATVLLVLALLSRRPQLRTTAG